MEITCKEAQKLVQPYIERRIDDRSLQALIDHIEACPSCREELETAYVVDYALRHLDEDLDASLHVTSIFAQDIAAAKEHLHHRRLLWIVVWILIILAACAALYIFSSYFLEGFVGFIRSESRRLYHYFRSQMG